MALFYKANVSISLRSLFQLSTDRYIWSIIIIIYNIHTFINEFVPNTFFYLPNYVIINNRCLVNLVLYRSFIGTIASDLAMNMYFSASTKYMYVSASPVFFRPYFSSVQKRTCSNKVGSILQDPTIIIWLPRYCIANS